MSKNVSVPNSSQLQQQLKKEQMMHKHYGSKYRPEALSHFPFIDENGTVYDVFHHPWSKKPDLLSMGEAGRNRFILKIFDTMRLDGRGIRLSDLPEALQVDLFILFFI